MNRLHSSMKLLSALLITLPIKIFKYIAMKKDREQRYNPDWLAVSVNIRVNRARNKCELCGLEHGKLIHKERNQKPIYANMAELAQLEYYKQEGMLGHWKRLKVMRLKQVVLTVAHKNHNERDDRPENLLALCQWCHLAYDRQDNARRRYYGYYQNQIPISYTEET